VARLRKAALAVVSPEALQDVFRVLLLRAQTGHLASMKLLFAYTLGKPAAALDPDEIEDTDEEPQPPQVIEPEVKDIEEDLEDEEEDCEPPEAIPEDPVTEQVKLVLQSLSSALNEIPQEVRDELASRFREQARPQPCPTPAPGGQQEKPRQTDAAKPRERSPACKRELPGPPDRRPDHRGPNQDERAEERRADGGPSAAINADP
jgi:hypothetical protein